MIPSIWFVQEGTNLSKDAMKSLEEALLSIDVNLYFFIILSFGVESLVPINQLANAMH
jgi:hypothetical protein